MSNVVAFPSANMNPASKVEIQRGERFAFGANWNRFLQIVDEDRIARAQGSLQDMLGVDNFEGSTFLDIGSGSGLFSLAAARMGARVTSFDFDEDSVACARELKRRFSMGNEDWQIGAGSILDNAYTASLGTFDIVYSWGVLHHTGRMWDAIDNAINRVSPGGKFFIAIYNDTGSQSRRWARIKKIYNGLPKFLRPVFALAVSAPNEFKALIRAIVGLDPLSFLRRWIRSNLERGMSHWVDIIDWVGGYPYEYAKPEEVFEFCKARGFVLEKMRCGGVGLGCNEFVFIKPAE